MAARSKDVNRKVVPRFRSLAGATRQGETASSSRGGAVRPDALRVAGEDTVRTLAADWRNHRTAAFAADLVGAALVLGYPNEARAAAEFLLSSERHMLAERVARRVLGDDPRDDHVDLDPLARDAMRARIRELKRGVRDDPHTALLWAELALRYASLGQRDKADLAMTIALTLAPTDRFLLRSGARLSLHLGDPERAHRSIAPAAASQGDPWLVAAEIAIAPLAGRTPRLVKLGRRLIDSDKFNLAAISELASALATEALAAGSGREARRLFEASLEDPTENSIAQAEWASGHGARIELDDELLEEVDAYEARAHVFAKEGNSDDAIRNAWDWVRAEPFGSIPAIFGSFESGLARRYDESIKFAEFGLIANPDSFLLRNNLAFALASLGDVSAAARHLSAIDVTRLNEEEGLVLGATSGLISFRRGDIEDGRALYKKTIERAKDPALAAVASILLAREEIIAATPSGSAARAIAARLVDAAQDAPSFRAERLRSWLDHLDAETGQGQTVVGRLARKS
jgi:tetratricopeptide (TPR) repeat protein